MDIREYDRWENTEGMRALIKEYVHWLGVDLGFQHIDAELADLSSVYSSANGGNLLIASEDEGPIGCVGLKRLGQGACEMKRLYVKPAFRGRGIGRALVEGIIDKARARGCKQVKLDMMPKSTVAFGIYQRMGFKPIVPYDADPHHAIFLGLELFPSSEPARSDHPNTSGPAGGGSCGCASDNICS